MIGYLINEKTYTTLNLPVKISGMYPIYNENILIANVVAENDKWYIQLGSEFTCEEISSSNEIALYKIYRFVSSYENKNFLFIATPKFDSTFKIYDFTGPISIGNEQSSDVYFPLSSTQAEVLKIQSFNNKWMVETNSSNFYIAGKSVKSGELIKNGDCIFFYGLKVIPCGSRIIINNPGNIAVINNENIKLRGVEPSYQVASNDYQNAKDLPLFAKEEYFYKAPRFNYAIEEKVVDIDEPPAPITENDMPLILTIGPQLTMISTSVLSMISYITSYMGGSSTPTRFWISMGIMATTITGALLWPTIARVVNKKRVAAKEKKREEKYTEYLKQKYKTLNLIKAEQKEAIINNHPSAEKCISIIENKTKELWQRSINHEDFLEVRLGVGKVKTKLKVDIPKEKFTIDDEDKLFISLKKVIDDSLYIDDAPITYTFTSKNINGIVGKDELVNEFMDCVFLQALTFHSYTDLKIVVFTKNQDKWDFLKIVPHCWDNQKKVRYFTTSVEELSIISNDLEKTFDARVADSDEEKIEDDGLSKTGKKDYNDFRPYYLFFIDDMTSVRNISLINKILRYKRNVGFSIIITSESISTLPSETTDFICLTEKDAVIMTSEFNSNQTIFVPDFNKNDRIDIYNCAQKLANIPILVEKEKYELPSSLSFLELYKFGRVEQLNSLARWNDNNPFLSLAVPIGVDQSGEVFKMDIHEKAYGPHGLIAGTTGSGKSEWIVTYILSLAVNFSPDEVQFVLIDYKGGGLAKSFENSELGIKLPHLAGTITNLDKSEINRSIAAIESELKRRQEIFNKAREELKEGSMNIYKYQQYYRKGLVEEPLSHLLIICDEFAELKQQQSEFMEQLISTSRIGRSLGVHLILATQKPSGVVNEQIWSNSKFKVCLKVQDKSDSNEVIKKPDAAFLKQTGAFYLQVGNDDYYNLGQAAWAGAKYYPSDTIKHKVDDSIKYIDNIGRTVGFYEEKENVEKKSEGEELLNIVAYISKISKMVPLKGKKLWLDNVSPKILLADIFKKYNRGPAQSFTYKIAIGEYDEPRKQEQGLLEIDLEEGNVAIIGQAGSGIDTLLSTIIYSSICEHTPYELAYYIIDFGAETLKKFAKFPHVGEVVFQDDLDKVVEVLDMILEELEKRKEILSDYNGSFSYFNKVNEKKMNLITVVINGFDIFSETLPKLNDILTNMFRDAPKYGIIFIVSVSSTSSLRQKQMQFFNHVIPMLLNDDSIYRTITNCRRGLIPKKVLGRGICKLDASYSDSYVEFQTAFIDEENKELETIKNYADKCIAYYKYKVKQLAKIPDDVTSADMIKYISDLKSVPIGLSFYEKSISKYDLLSQKIHLFTGRNIKNNMNFIYGLTTILSKIPGVKIRVVDMLDLFKKPILDIKLFNEDIDVVFAALEKDVLTRTDAQDYGINLIIGAGSYKRHLSKGGIEIFKNLFTCLPNSKKSIYILIDDYDKIRTLKLEKWFDEVNTENGLWIGSNFSNQSLFTCKEPSSEDKKYDFEGLAYNICNKDYSVIKTVMDGDD